MLIKQDSGEEDDEDEDDEELLLKRENEKAMIQNMLSNLQWPAVSPSVTLEALQNTKVSKNRNRETSQTETHT